MTARTSTKEERQLAYLWLVAAASAIALKPLWLKIAPLLRPCVFRSLTEIPCPTCGTTRAATAFLDGDLMSALAANPLAAIAGFIFVFGAPVAVLWTLARWPMPVLTTPWPRWVRIAAIVLIVANWAFVIAAA